MVQLAELLADLTSLKTITTDDALSLVNPTPTSHDAADPTDTEFTRVKEFLKLRSEQRDLDDLIAKRRAVGTILERFERKADGW